MNSNPAVAYDLAALLSLCAEGVREGKRRGADEVEVTAAFGESSSVSFEKNDLQIASSDSECSFGVRVIRGDCVGFATSNDPETLADTVADALVIAAAAVPDPCNRLPDARPMKPIDGLYDETVRDLTVARMTTIGAALLDRVRSRDRRVSIDNGSVSASFGRRAIVSSRGVQAADEGTSVGGSLFGMAIDGDEVGSFVVEGIGTRRAEGLEARLLEAADRFVEKSIGALHPQKGESYKGLVLFSPEAVESLLVGNLVTMISSPTIRKGKSPLATKLGQAVASSNFTLVDDGTRAGENGSSMLDREGLPHERTVLVENGVFRTAIYNHYEALRAGRPGGSTGHAAGGVTGLPSVGTTTLRLEPGSTALAEIIRGAGRCVLVTRFSGSTNVISGEFSGVVKAGFLLKDGEKRPITETLISGNLLDVFKGIAAVSSEIEKLYGHEEMPHVLADGISVTAG